MRHTPGPWEAKFQPFSPAHTIGKRASNGSLDLIADLRESVAQGDERQANARLISAAPDLLAALKALRASVNEIQGYWTESIDNNMRLADEIITKATQP